MLKKLSNFYRPITIDEACALLGSNTAKNVALAGGTYLAELNDFSIEGLVDLSKLGLNYIKEDDKNFYIGAMTPVQDIYKSQILSGATGDLLKSSAKKIGTTLLRNSITIGGNIVALLPWSDMPLSLLALDAEVVVHKGVPKKTIPIHYLFEKQPKDFLDKSEIITEIVVPKFGYNTSTSYIKFSKTENDYSLVTVAIRLTFDNLAVTDARIIIGGCTKKPFRCLESEQYLIKTKDISNDTIEAVAQKATTNIELINDIRASKEYRLQIIPILVKRGIGDAISKYKTKHSIK